MSINLQRVGEATIPDGSITTIKLANDAVTDPKIADGSIINSKLAALAISTGKLQNNVVTLAKSDRALKIHHLLTDDTEAAEVGTTPTEIKTYKFIKAANVNEGFVPGMLIIQADLKTSNVAQQAKMELNIDGGAVVITLTSVSLTAELLTGEADISALADGSHTVSVKLSNADVAETTTNQLFTSFLEK